MKNKIIITALILLIIGITTIALTTNNDTLPSIVQFMQNAAGGVQKLFFSIGQAINKTARAVYELRRLQDNYEALLSEVGRLSHVEDRIDLLEKENQRLREQLGFASQTKRPTLVAQVIAWEEGDVFASITLNRGKRHGIIKDLPVVGFTDNKQGLVGRIIESNSGTSVVMPIFESQSYLGARVTTTRYEGLIKGGGSRNVFLELHHIPLKARSNLEYGDMIETSGLNSLFPASLSIGEIEEISTLEYEPTLFIRVKPIVDFSRLEYVLVLLPDGFGRSEK